MGVTNLSEILKSALAGGYGVPAINIFNDLTLEGVLKSAAANQSPVIVQTSVKTVRMMGSDVIASMWEAMTRKIDIPVALHLDHCPDRAVISECLERGWNSVLFDASALPVEENLRQTIEVVQEARRYGAHVEGEIESITGVEDGIGSDTESKRQTLEVAIDFIERTGVDVFAPAIGNAHGRYAAAPVLDVGRVQELFKATGLPMALHGGSGLTAGQFAELIASGCAKVNISTALKEVYMRANLDYLKSAEKSDKWDPPSLFSHTLSAVEKMTSEHIILFGSNGKGI
jgi:fructose-bisphosphate aldolase class II